MIDQSSALLNSSGERASGDTIVTLIFSRKSAKVVSASSNDGGGCPRILAIDRRDVLQAKRAWPDRVNMSGKRPAFTRHRRRYFMSGRMLFTNGHQCVPDFEMATEHGH